MVVGITDCSWPVADKKYIKMDFEKIRKKINKIYMTG